MRKLFLIVIFSTIIFAQNKFDSLIESIKNHPDSAQITALNNFSWRYRNINPQLAIRAAEQSLKLSEKNDDKVNQAKALSYLSIIYRDQGEYQKSIELSKSSLERATSIDDWEEIGYSFNNLASIYRLMGNYPLALENAYKGLAIFDRVNDKKGYAYSCYTIGMIYLRQNNLRKANENFELTYKIRKTLNDKEGAAKALGRMAEVHFEQGEYKEALENYNNVEVAYKELNDQKSLISIWMGRASVYEKLNDYDKALSESKRALLQAKIFDDVDGVVRNSSMIGILLGRLGKFSEGKIYLDSAVAMSKKVNSSFLRLNSLKNSTEFYELQNDFKNAYMYSKLYNNYRDSLAKKENSSVISEVESAYITNKKEKENELLQKDLEYQKKVIAFWIVALILLIVITGVIIRLYSGQRRANAIKDKLFSIIAHDLKNPFSVVLNSARILSDKNWEKTEEEKEQYIEMIANASGKTNDLLENLLYWSRSQREKLSFLPEKVDLKEIIDDTMNLVLEQAAQKSIMLINDAKPKSIVSIDLEMLKLILRNLLTNAVKFSKLEGKITASARMENSFWIVSISDNGVGIPKEKLDKIFVFNTKKSSFGTRGEKGTGLGLMICKEFIEKSGGKIWVESEVDKGTTFYFSLPVKE